MNIKNSKGFTLVEMLVVIAIISVLAAALFPAINNALQTASATAMKTKGRGIWVAITSANMEREPLNKGSLWPKDLLDDPPQNVTLASSLDYFNYLLSDGSGTTPTDEVELKVVADLTPDALIASGLTAGTLGTALTAKNLAWGVMQVQDGTPGEIPFLISKNYTDETALSQQSEENDADRLTLGGDNGTAKPFGKTRAVWVTRGGGTFDARAKYFTKAKLMGLGDTTTTYDYWSTAQQ